MRVRTDITPKQVDILSLTQQQKLAKKEPEVYIKRTQDQEEKKKGGIGRFDSSSKARINYF